MRCSKGNSKHFSSAIPDALVRKQVKLKEQDAVSDPETSNLTKKGRGNSP